MKSLTQQNYGKTYDLNTMTEIIIKLQNKDVQNRKDETVEERAKRENMKLNEILLKYGSNNGNIALCAKWATKWDSFISGTTKTIPEKIDHSLLDDGNGMTKLELRYKVDYVDICEEMWNYLSQNC